MEYAEAEFIAKWGMSYDEYIRLRLGEHAERLGAECVEVYDFDK